LRQHCAIPTVVKLAPQRLEKRLVRTHEEPVLQAILACRPKTFPHWRIHTLVSTILDTGCRIEEVLTARIDERRAIVERHNPDASRQARLNLCESFLAPWITAFVFAPLRVTTTPPTASLVPLTRDATRKVSPM